MLGGWGGGRFCRGGEERRRRLRRSRHWAAPARRRLRYRCDFGAVQRRRKQREQAGKRQWDCGPLPTSAPPAHTTAMQPEGFAGWGSKFPKVYGFFFFWGGGLGAYAIPWWDGAGFRVCKEQRIGGVEAVEKYWQGGCRAGGHRACSIALRWGLEGAPVPIGGREGTDPPPISSHCTAALGVQRECRIWDAWSAAWGGRRRACAGVHGHEGAMRGLRGGFRSACTRNGTLEGQWGGTAGR